MTPADPALRLLLALWDAHGRELPMRDLLRITGTPPDAPAPVHSMLDELTRRGCLVERSPAGVRLAAAGLGTWEDLITAFARRHHWRLGRNARIFSQISSTNDAAFVAAARPNSDGTLILANHQTAGRGRLGRSWLAQPNQSILLSIVLRDIPADRLDRLTLLAGLACALGIEQALANEHAAMPQLEIKWPNDLLVSLPASPARKLAGILVETRRLAGPAGAADAAIVGIGINVAQTAAEFPPDLAGSAISLYVATGLLLDRLRILLPLLESLDHHLTLTHDDQWIQPWKQRCGMLGRRMSFRAGDRSYSGQVLDVDPAQGLVIRDDQGMTHFLSARTCSIG